MLRQDRLQHGRAEFGRLFGDIIDARRASPGRRQMPDIGLGDLFASALVPRATAAFCRGLSSVGPFRRRGPLTPGAGTVGRAWDVEQIVDLTPRQRDAYRRGKERPRRRARTRYVEFALEH